MKLLFFLLLIPLLALAQSSSENFILTKAVIDAGGGESSSESFQQLSAFGQPSPLGAQTSENFTLYPGFLWPEFAVLPLSPIQELVIWENQPNIDLSWEAIPDAGIYYIYRDTDPEFTPSAGNLLGSTTSTSFTDAGITATTQAKYFYIVKSGLGVPVQAERNLRARE